MVKDWIVIAVKPLVVDRKHIFRPLAGHHVVSYVLDHLMLRNLEGWAPLKGALSTGLGPETPIRGLVQLRFG